MNLSLHPEAEIEFWESVEFYEKQGEGVGVRFKEEVDEALLGILANPELPRLRSKFYRRVNLERFSHYIAYIIRGNEIRVLAISHGHRKPEHWLGRQEP